jgi:ubiquinol oxidase
VLETVARVPYFAYLSVMHLRETFGERDPKLGERMRTHYAEADNELHHLLIMEALGGNSSLVDRTVGALARFQPSSRIHHSEVTAAPFLTC